MRMFNMKRKFCRHYYYNVLGSILLIVLFFVVSNVHTDDTQNTKKNIFNYIFVSGTKVDTNDNNDGNDSSSNKKTVIVAVGKDGTISNIESNNNYNENNNNNILPSSSSSSSSIITNNADYNKRLLQQKDINLQPIPNDSNFNAFVRPDVSTYYNTKNSTSSINYTEQRNKFHGLAGTFINMSPYRVSLYWKGYDGTVYKNSDLGPFGSGGTATFVSHQFILTVYKQPTNIICTFTIVSQISTYYCDPYYTTSTPPKTTTVNKYKYSRPGVVSTDKHLSIDTLSTTDRADYDRLVYNLQFGDDYKNFTGSPWLTYYPPNPVMLPIWPADYIGQTHTIYTNETHYHTQPPIHELTNQHQQPLTPIQMKYPSTYFPKLVQYRHPGLLNITLTVVSCMPRAFVIDNFLSDVEVNHIVTLIQKEYNNSMVRSTTSGQISSTRTSRTTWIKRNKDVILNSIHRRAADVLQIHEGLLRHRTVHDDDNEIDNIINQQKFSNLKSKDKISEDVQIVHYDKDQQYTAHHDFGYPKGLLPEQKLDRFLNLAMYLNNVQIPTTTITGGGTTSFPRWRNGHTSEPLHIIPQQGKALLFYLVHPDGNPDDLSQHAGTPVLTGEKYFSNLWIRSYL